MGMGDGSSIDLSGVAGSPGYGVLQSSGDFIDPSIFTNQDFSGASSPGYGVLDSSGAPNQFIGSLADLPSNTVGNLGGGGGGFNLAKILGTSLGALGPALSAAGQIAKLALDQGGDKLHFPVVQAGHFAPFGGLSPQRAQEAPRLAGDIPMVPNDPMTMYATMVRSMR